MYRRRRQRGTSILRLAEITVETARELLKLELRRCEELMAAHFANACDGDVVATNTVLRVMAHRAMLMGWSRDQQGAAGVMISEVVVLVVATTSS